MAFPGLEFLEPWCLLLRHTFFPSPEMEYVGRYANSLGSQGSLAASCSKVRQIKGEGSGLEAEGKGLMCCSGSASAPRARGTVHMVVAETDYQSFAILYLEQARKLSVKLYGTY